MEATSSIPGPSQATDIGSITRPDAPSDVGSAPPSDTHSHVEAPAEQAPDSTPSRSDGEVLPLSSWRRWLILLTVCWLPIPTTFAVQSIFAAAPEVAAGLSVPESSISTANAGVFVAMAMSPLLWVPLLGLMGRRPAYVTAATALCICSAAEALAPNMGTFATVWVISGMMVVVFFVSGQAIIADVFVPTTRGMASGIFLATTVSAQMIAPLTGGILATYTSWRVIYGVQAGMALIGAIFSYLYIPDERTEDEEARHGNPPPFHKQMMQLFSPIPVFRLFKHREVICIGVSCGLISFTQYGLLTAIRSAVTEQLRMTSPQTSGLFYLAPGIGFLVGSLVGGRISDSVVKRYIRRRNGVLRPSDRLRVGFWGACLTPTGSLVFGWSLQGRAGGVYFPAVAAFVTGVGIMASFGPLNTYAAEVFPDKKVSVVSAKYMVQFLFAALTIGTRVRALEAIGIGWTFTISSVAAFGAAGILFIMSRTEVRSEPPVEGITET